MTHRREILAIALPAIVSNLTTPILGLVDVAISGHIGDAVYIGAIAVGGNVFNMLYWLLGFLRMGTSGLTAQAYGAADIPRQAMVLYRSLLIAIVTGVAMIALSAPIADTVLRFMDADGATAGLARRYFAICIWGAPAVMATYTLTGWFIGMQDSRAAMWMSLITNVVNIAVSVTAVFGLGMKIEGVALGTCLAQWIGVAAGAVMVWRRYSPVLPPLRSVAEWGALRSFFRINADIFLRTCCLVAVTLWFTHAGAVAGTDILAANAILLQLFMLFSYFIDGFAYSGEALAGKYAGASDTAALHTLVKQLLRTGLICALGFALLYMVGGSTFIGLLSDDATVVAIARSYLPWAIVLPLCGYAAFIWDGIYIGMVRPRVMLLSMATAMAVFFSLYFSLRTTLGNHALWLAFDTYLLARAAVERLAWPHIRG